VGEDVVSQLSVTELPTLTTRLEGVIVGLAGGSTQITHDKMIPEIMFDVCFLNTKK
jgi:hypothetical protein